MRTSLLKDLDVICFSHLRWNFVYQRPQHLLTRFANNGRVFFIEEPVWEDDRNTDEFIVVKQENCNVWVVTPHLSKGADVTPVMTSLLNRFLRQNHIKKYIAWYYSPMAMSFSNQLTPTLVVYDCMDELSAFRFAPPALKQYESMLFDKADIVFTGGFQLYKAKQYLHHNIHPFPSSIDKEHFSQARMELPQPPDQACIPKARIGFYGVVDERFNVPLLKGVANQHPDWQFVVLGPVVKIDPQTLPRLDNIHFLGGKSYYELPTYLSGWDVAMMPFALNESTKYISPTKTPEYLAGGKPVVSTSIRDVVVPYGKNKLVHIADTVKDFSKAIGQALNMKGRSEWLNRVDNFLANISWDNTYDHMAQLIQKTMMEKQNLGRGSKKEAYV